MFAIDNLTSHKKLKHFFAETKVFSTYLPKILRSVFALNKKSPYICVTLRESKAQKVKNWPMV